MTKTPHKNGVRKAAPYAQAKKKANKKVLKLTARRAKHDRMPRKAVGSTGKNAVHVSKTRKPKAMAFVAPEMVVSPHQVRSEEVMRDPKFAEYLGRKVGKRAVEVVTILATPQTDEKVAEVMAVKVNEVRRMLNVLNSYSLVRYDVNKDNKGWLTFKWYLDREKIAEFGDNVIAKEGRTEYSLPQGCNDFFVCDTCYKDQKLVLPFDNAFESAFKCECGSKLRMISRQETEALFAQDGKVL